MAKDDFLVHHAMRLDRSALKRATMLKVSEIDAYYGRTQALREVSLELGQKEIACLIGANGAGKTTLLNVISGLHRPKKGKIEFFEKEITQLSPERIVGEGIIQIPEGRELFKALTTQENLEMGAYLRFKRRERKEIQDDLERIAGMFPILKIRAHQVAGTLSGGEQQMLAIGRGLMGKPKLMLMDEPSLGLAPLAVREIFNVISALNEAGIHILLVEQNAKAALKISKHCYVMLRGRIVLHGPSVEMAETEEIKRAYLGHITERKQAWEKEVV